MNKSWTQLVDLQQRRMADEAVLERCANQLPDATRLSDIVHRKLAWEALLFAARAYDRGRTEQTPVEDLTAFAFECWPEANRLVAYRGLRLRQYIGARTMPYLQPLVLSAVARRAQSWWWRRSWALRGL